MSEKILEQRKEHIRTMQICRLCLCRGKPLINIHERSTLSVPLAVQLMACLRIEVYQSDGLPTSICPVCNFFVQQCYAFYQVTKRGERALADVLESGVYSGAIPYPDDMIKNMKLATASLPTQMEDPYEDDIEVDSEVENQLNVVRKPDAGQQTKIKKETSTINVVCQGDELHISAEQPEGSGDEELGEEEEEVEEEEGEEEEEEVEEMESEEMDTSYEGEGFACTQCDRAFPLSQLLKLHVKQYHRSRNVSCQVCQQRFFTKYDLMTHMLVHTGQKPFKCVACHACFSRLALLKRHEKEVHPDIPKLACSECTLTFLSEEELEAHSAKHGLNQNRRYQCTECSKKFTHKQGLTRHIAAIHGGKSALKCDYCPAAFSTLPKLARHVQSHASRPYPCKYCDKTFIKSHHYTRHLRLKHSDAQLRRSTSDNYKCEQCEETFDNKDDLIYHSAIHATQDLTCPLCKETFQDIDAVTQHVKSHMTGEQFLCELCQLIFTSETRLEQHMVDEHDENDEQDEHDEDTREHEEEEEIDEDEICKMEEMENLSMEVDDDLSRAKAVAGSDVEGHTVEFTLEVEGPTSTSDIRPVQESNKIGDNVSEVIYTELKTVDTLKIAQNQLRLSQVEMKDVERSLQKTTESSAQNIKPPQTPGLANKTDKGKFVQHINEVSVHLQRVDLKPEQRQASAQSSPARPTLLTRAESERIGERRARNERGKAQKRMSSSIDEGVTTKKPALAKPDDKKTTVFERNSTGNIKKLPEFNKKPADSPKKVIETVTKPQESNTTSEAAKKRGETPQKPVDVAKKVVEPMKKIIDSSIKLGETIKRSGDVMKKSLESVKKLDVQKKEEKQPTQKSNDKSLKMLEKDLLELKMGARASLATPGRGPGRSTDRQTDGRKEKASSVGPQASSTPMRKPPKLSRDSSAHSTPITSRSGSPIFSPPHTKLQNSKPAPAKKDSIATNNTKSTPAKKDAVAMNNKSASTSRDSISAMSAKSTPLRKESTVNQSGVKSASQSRDTPVNQSSSKSTPQRRESSVNQADEKSGPQSKQSTVNQAGAKFTPQSKQATVNQAGAKPGPMSRKSIATPVGRDSVAASNDEAKEEKVIPTQPVMKKALGISARVSDTSSEASPRRSSRPCRVKDYAKMIKNKNSTDEKEADGVHAAEEETARTEDVSSANTEIEESSNVTDTEIKEEIKSQEAEKSIPSGGSIRTRGRPRKVPSVIMGRGARGGVRGGRPRGTTRGGRGRGGRPATPDTTLSEVDTDFSDDGDDEYELPQVKKTRKVYPQQHSSSMIGMKVHTTTPGALTTGTPASLASAGAVSSASTTVPSASPLTPITKKLTPVTPPATIAQQAAVMRLQQAAQGSPTAQPSPGPTPTSSGLKVLMTPSGQTLTPVGSPAVLKNLPPGAKPTTVPPGKSILQGVGAGQLVDMQLGQRKVKVQKIVMSKQEVERMAKSGMLEMKDGAMVLKTGYKLPASFKPQMSVKPDTQPNRQESTTSTTTTSTTPTTPTSQTEALLPAI